MSIVMLLVLFVVVVVVRTRGDRDDLISAARPCPTAAGTATAAAGVAADTDLISMLSTETLAAVAHAVL